ncbi:MAG: hypothetical protein LBG69_06305 [Zoogloeaceae bacterium]|jgi:hypothetical protein|nr:hypothetical protein [Zoogloeaceae bacterium]
MKKVLLSLALLLPAIAALAQEPPYIYKQFAFIPKQFVSGSLSAAQKADLDFCLQTARERQEQAKVNPSGMGDLFGVSMSECLTNDEQGKGWNMLEKTAAGWKPVPVHRAVRTLMGFPN